MAAEDCDGRRARTLDRRLTACQALSTPQRHDDAGRNRSEVTARNGVVAAGHAQTAAAACIVLEEGGNAIDAALAGLLAACVAEPVLASLGGGGFLVACPADGRSSGRTVVYDFFVQTPRRCRPEAETDLREIAADFGPTTQTFHIGLGAIATPGVVKGLFAAHRDLGRLPLRRLFEPAVALAREGIAIDAMQAYVFRVVRAIVQAEPSIRALFDSPGRPGETIGEGEKLRLPHLADALEAIAIEGEDLFYRGEMAARLAADCRAAGGHLTRADLEAYRVERRRPLTVPMQRARVELNPPPACGGILVGFGLALYQALGPLRESFGSAEHLRRLVGVMRATERARIEERVQQRVAEPAAAEGLLDAALIARWRDEIAAAATSRGTTHVSVVDAAGGVASLSVSNGEGSAYVLPGTGIILNNMLGEPDLLPDGIATWPLDCRLSSMMAPALVRDAAGGTIALGSGGSNRIRTAMLQVLVNLLAFSLSPEDAVNADRLHCEGAVLSVEPGLADQAIVAAIAETDLRAETWPAQNLFFGGVHLARRSATGTLEGAGDARRGGVARQC